MGYAVVHVEKYNAASLRGIGEHNERGREQYKDKDENERKEYVSGTNPDIDNSKTAQNIVLKRPEHSLRVDTMKRARELWYAASRGSEWHKNRKMRKDAVVACGFIISSDKESFMKMGEEKTKAYFEKALKFLEERYGKENVVSAIVHMDEKTPHLHCYIVPEYEGTLNAKKLINPIELRSLQTDFALEVAKEFGLDRGREGSKAKHIETARWKEQQAEKQVQNFNKHMKYYRHKKPVEVKATPVPFTNKVMIDKDELAALLDIQEKAEIVQKDNRVVIERNKALTKDKERLSERVRSYQKEQQEQDAFLKEFTAEEMQQIKSEAQKRKEKKREERQRQRKRDLEWEF